MEVQELMKEIKSMLDLKKFIRGKVQVQKVD